ncbi:MAG: OmpA family protein [Polyangiaceae bacterium]|nr:OmpA family protein [Polyangiaceae bacterium]
MIKNVASTVIVVAGLTLLGCGATQERATDQTEARAAGKPDSSDTSSEELMDSEESASETNAPDEDLSEASSDTDTSSDLSTDETEDGVGQCNPSTKKLALTLDRDSLNLEKGRAQATMDGPICRIELTITRLDGQEVKKTFRYDGPQRELRWNGVPRDETEKVEIRAYAENGAYAGVKIVPWSVTIPHEEVQFDTDKANIRSSEVKKLQDSLEKIRAALRVVQDKNLGTITLFVAGHTDTMGSDEHNLDLSRRRAQSISGWFMQNGLCIPIAFEGFGENALKKQTADQVDCQENRRADYILSVEPPTMKKGGTPNWKWISRGC